ncbi:cytochrome ubiquinol oxidase subunit I, partial [Staphylococcus aureus]|uniref:cytochrome ubiquinol oxidase subunit I n=1 Tax=Staphylococcus aureus TaxID=1280 RepID=UPI001642D589
LQITPFFTAITLPLHIIFPTIALPIPLIFPIPQFLPIHKNHLQYIPIPKTSAKPYTITLPVPLLTPTIIPLQLSFISPTFMQMPAHLIPLPLFIQTFPFFFQAIFLSIYLYTSRPFKNKST